MGSIGPIANCSRTITGFRCVWAARTSAANRGPQPRFGEWNAYEKDDLEGYACRMVCAGRIGLSEVQGWFLAPADWRAAYRRIFGHR